MPVRTFRPPHPVDLRLTLAPLQHGHADPCVRFVPGGVWRATRTPAGPAATHLSTRGDEITARAWGPGAGWALEAAPALVGAGDDDRSFRPVHPAVADLHRRLPGVRIPRSRAVMEAAVPAILEQKVQAVAAYASWRALVRRYGERAPGPAGAAGLMVPPDPALLAGTPSWALHPLGVERKRADTVRLASRHARRLEEATRLAPAGALRRLQVLPGMGPWTAAEVAVVALGDADAVSVGDYHLPHQVAWALAGEARGDDARMLELLEPYRGHRARVVRLLAAGGVMAPRFGPRLPLHPVARL